MPFTEKQEKFCYEATHRWNIKEGATRSGKTFLDYYVIPQRILAVENEPGIVVILGNTRATVQRNIIEPLQRIWGEALVRGKADGNVYIFGQKCYCLGADKITQVDRLRGSSIKYCYGDEVVTWNEEVFQMLKSRLDKPYSKFDGTCNPGSPEHWFYKFLINEKKDLDIYRQSYSIDDNPTLDEEVVRNLKAEYSGSVYYDRYILGKWTRAEGLIYDTFTDDLILEEQETEKPYFRKWVAVDYGTQNATCFLLIGEYKNTLYVLKEYYYSGREEQKQKTDAQYATDMMDFIKGHRIETIIVDPSAASFIAELRSRGLPAEQADNTVLDGIRYTSSQFGLKKLFVCESCKNLIKELYSYSWQKDKEAPVKESDHACDALRYGVMYKNNNLFVSY